MNKYLEKIAGIKDTLQSIAAGAKKFGKDVTGVNVAASKNRLEGIRGVKKTLNKYIVPDNINHTIVSAHQASEVSTLKNAIADRTKARTIAAGGALGVVGGVGIATAKNKNK